MTQPPEVPYGEPEHQMGSPLPRWLRWFADEPPVGEPGRLAEPPRAVPLRFRVSALALGPVEAAVLFVVTVPFVGLWIGFPNVRAVAYALIGGYLLLRGYLRFRKRVGILRWGREAVVTRTDSRTSGGFRNVPVRQAHGWVVDSRLFTGTGTTTVISHELDGRPGRLTLRGLPYVDGVVLADSRHPERGMVVSQFPHPVRPGPDGQWAGALSPGRWGWVALSLAAQLVLLALAVRFVILRG